jgi:hypothetical protein
MPPNSLPRSRLAVDMQLQRTLASTGTYKTANCWGTCCVLPLACRTTSPLPVLQPTGRMFVSHSSEQGASCCWLQSVDWAEHFVLILFLHCCPCVQHVATMRGKNGFISCVTCQGVQSKFCSARDLKGCRTMSSIP